MHDKQSSKLISQRKEEKKAPSSLHSYFYQKVTEKLYVFNLKEKWIRKKRKAGGNIFREAEVD